MSASVTAQGAAQHEAAATTEARPLAWYGMVFFIASEAVFFANLIAAYLYLRVRAGAWPAPSDAAFTFELNKVLVGINTVILLSSSFPMHRAGRAAARGDRARAGAEPDLYGDPGRGVLEHPGLRVHPSSFGPTSGIFGSTFYTLTGFHGAHVTAGLIFILVTTVRAARGHFSAKHHLAVQAAEMYWHFVDVVWDLPLHTGVSADEVMARPPPAPYPLRWEGGVGQAGGRPHTSGVARASSSGPAVCRPISRVRAWATRG